MQAQRTWQRRKAQAVGLQRLAIEVDVQPLRTGDLDPGQTRPHEQTFTRQQITKGAYHFLGCWQDGDIEQAIIDLRFRAQYLSATGLATVADPQRQQVALPLEARPDSSTEAACSSLKRDSPVNR